MKTLATVLLFLILVAPVSPQGSGSARPSLAKSQLAAAELYSKEIDSFIKQNPKSKRIFGNVASANENARAKWREFKDEAELDAGEEFPETAGIWLRNGKVVGAVFTSQTSSRDWAQFVTYYFREDGTLVKSKETFNTFYANISVERKKVYGPTGKLLHASSKYFDMRTGLPKKPNGFASVRAPVYLRVRSLPFSRLI